MAPPFQSCEFDILFGKGISHSGDVLDLGVEERLVEKSGAWYSYNGERIGQGRDNARTYLEEHPAILTTLEGQLLERKGIHRPQASGAEEPSDQGMSTTNGSRTKAVRARA
jgi:recombination protein RecA